MNDSLTEALNGSSGSSASKGLLTGPEEAFYLGTGIAGVVFNALVLFIGFRHVDTHDKPRQLIVIHMTAADLLMCLIYCVTRPFVHAFPLFLCYPYYIVICSVQLVSCFNLLWLNIDKFVFVQFPLHYYSIVTRARLMVLTTLTWIVILIYTAVGYATLQYIPNPIRCDRVVAHEIFVVSLPVVYVLILVGSFVTSFLVFIIARRTCEIENKSHATVLRQFFFLFSSTLWTFFTCLPYRVLYMYGMIAMMASPEAQARLHGLYRVVMDASFQALVVGIVINPWITILTQRIYRVRLVQYGKLIFCRPQKKASIDYSAVSKDTKSRRTSGRNTSSAECRTLADNTGDL